MERIDKLKLAVEKGFKYNPETGDVIGPRGKILKRINKYGYLQFKVVGYDKKQYCIFNHLFAWYFIYNRVEVCLDHVNGIRSDNKLINLRSVTRQENNFNYLKAKGYYFNKRESKYKAAIGINNKQIHLGYFDTEEEARNAYLKAKEQYHIIKNP